MKRRRLLAAVFTSVAGFAGCLSNAKEQETPTTASTPLSEYGCPPSNSLAEPAICSHTVDTSSTSVYLLPSETTGDTPAGTVELTLHNDSPTELEFNPYEWSILTKVSSGWEAIEGNSSGNGRLILSPDDTQTWAFDEVVGFINESVTVDSGTYVAGIRVPNPETSDWVRCIALFRLG
ncbi:hypothetical protein [Halorubrum sp. DM2]|uniref:hypothetical protein n=1 Tax=Halorubrum sp. DM2 TaxID=2527867 RepID=UPI0024B79BC6|nr:hypothetical protein [Halorubrum sp. DM2]